MASATNPTGRPVSPSGTGGADSPTKSYVQQGMGAVRSAISSAGGIEWKARGASALYTIFVAPVSYVWNKLVNLKNWCSDKIYGHGRVVDGTIKIQEKGYVWGTSLNEYTVEYALSSHRITPKDALEKNYCNEAFLTARGYGLVKFQYTWLGMTYNYEGKLRTALRKGYITIDEAIDQQFITKAQAIEGGYLKAEKPAKTTK